ncbi:hypothetical protein [Chelativorans xinjiangense]|uniref:hypothetical protein n=1 Tax=Chelativorans xinjiangense TaxID=2681485 RepID=UPI001357B6AF|nr:hypothetical protein [Chelativorans xinjiangense]
MKAGKESIAGLIGALEAWEKRDHEGIRREEDRKLNVILKTLDGLPGLIARKVPDPTGNPLDRIMLAVLPEEAEMTAAQMAEALARETVPIIVRGHEVELGHFFIDVCNLRDGEETIVGKAIARLVR